MRITSKARLGLKALFGQGAHLGLAQKALALHSKPSRGYHAPSHLIELLEKTHEEALRGRLRRSLRGMGHGAKAAALRAFGLSILFHDAVYESENLALYAQNESRSAKLFWGKRKALGAQGSCALMARAWIKDTQKRQARQKGAANGLERLFLDLDMSILASDAKRLESYDAGVRHEFKALPETQFAQGRAQALRGLCSGKIFQSKEFRSREGKAIANCARLIAFWEKKAKKAKRPAAKKVGSKKAAKKTLVSARARAKKRKKAGTMPIKARNPLDGKKRKLPIKRKPERPALMRKLTPQKAKKKKPR